MYCYICKRLTDYHESGLCEICKRESAHVNFKSYILSLLKDLKKHAPYQIRRKIDKVIQL